MQTIQKKILKTIQKKILKTIQKKILKKTCFLTLHKYIFQRIVGLRSFAVVGNL